MIVKASQPGRIGRISQYGVDLMAVTHRTRGFQTMTLRLTKRESEKWALPPRRHTASIRLLPRERTKHPLQAELQRSHPRASSLGSFPGAAYAHEVSAPSPAPNVASPEHRDSHSS